MANIDSIREAHCGAAYYSNKYARQYIPCVVANTVFAPGALELASSTGTRTIDRKILSSMLGKITMPDIIAMEGKRIPQK